MARPSGRRKASPRGHMAQQRGSGRPEPQATRRRGTTKRRRRANGQAEQPPGCCDTARSSRPILPGFDHDLWRASGGQSAAGLGATDLDRPRAPRAVPGNPAPKRGPADLRCPVEDLAPGPSTVEGTEKSSSGQRHTSPISRSFFPLRPSTAAVPDAPASSVPRSTGRPSGTTEQRRSRPCGWSGWRCPGPASAWR
jgi:hypothetical protein